MAAMDHSGGPARRALTRCSSTSTTVRRAASSPLVQVQAGPPGHCCSRVRRRRNGGNSGSAQRRAEGDQRKDAGADQRETDECAADPELQPAGVAAHPKDDRRPAARHHGGPQTERDDQGSIPGERPAVTREVAAADDRGERPQSDAGQRADQDDQPGEPPVIAHVEKAPSHGDNMVGGEPRGGVVGEAGSAWVTPAATAEEGGPY